MALKWVVPYLALNSFASASPTSTWRYDNPAPTAYPRLTQDDMHFINVEMPQLLALGSEGDFTNSTPASTQKRDDNAVNLEIGGIFDVKWRNLGMDAWLVEYVHNVTVYNGDTLLSESTDFIHDFWGSTVGQVAIDRLITLTPVRNEAGSRSDISPQWKSRAYLARMALVKWHNNIRASYNIINDASLFAKTDISTMINALKFDDAPPPGSMLEVFALGLAVVGIICPAVAPAAALLGGAIAVGKATGIVKRDDEGTVVAQALDDSAFQSVDDVDTDTSSVKLSKRALEFDEASKKILQDFFNNPVPGQTVHVTAGAPAPGPTPQAAVPNAIRLEDIDERVKKLEAKKLPTTSEQISAGVKKAGDALEKLSKVITAIKALEPKLTDQSLGTWDVMPMRMQDIFTSYSEAIELAFLRNRQTFHLRTFTAADGSPAAVGGMQNVMANGEFLVYRTSDLSTSLSHTRKRLERFFKRLAFMEIVRNQALYFVRETFRDQAACQKIVGFMHTGEQIEKAAADCVQVNGVWELHALRRPYKNVKVQVDRGAVADYPLDFSRWFQRQTSQDGKVTLFQDKDHFQDNSGMLSSAKWSDRQLQQLGLGVTRADIYNNAFACQQKHGDPFSAKDGKPTYDQLYRKPIINMDAVLAKSDADSIPICTFGIPIYNLGNEADDKFCLTGIRSRNILHRRNRLFAFGSTCSQWAARMQTRRSGRGPVERFQRKLWLLVGESKLCGGDVPANVHDPKPRPGCGLHDRGFYGAETQYLRD